MTQDEANKKLFEAVNRNDIEGCNYAINQGAQANATNRRTRITPLHCAASTGNVEIGELLLQKGAEIDAIDDEDRTPLHYAAKADKREFSEFLINNGANPTILDFMLNTPGDEADTFDNEALGKMLHEAAAKFKPNQNHADRLDEKHRNQGKDRRR
jgi:ankyrin repeat protein